MNQPIHDSPDDAMPGPLGEAVAFVRSQPAPPDAMRHTVTTAAGWGDSPPPRALPSHRTRYLVALGGIAAAACVVAGIVVFDAMDRRDRHVAGGNPTAPIGPGPSTASRPSVANFYMPVPLTHPVVAEAAPVFVTIGPAEPAMLGARVTHADLLAGMD